MINLFMLIIIDGCKTLDFSSALSAMLLHLFSSFLLSSRTSYCNNGYNQHSSSSKIFSSRKSGCKSEHHSSQFYFHLHYPFNLLRANYSSFGQYNFFSSSTEQMSLISSLAKQYELKSPSSLASTPDGVRRQILFYFHTGSSVSDVEI